MQTPSNGLQRLESKCRNLKVEPTHCDIVNIFLEVKLSIVASPEVPHISQNFSWMSLSVIWFRHRHNLVKSKFLASSNYRMLPHDRRKL